MLPDLDSLEQGGPRRRAWRPHYGLRKHLRAAKRGTSLQLKYSFAVLIDLILLHAIRNFWFYRVIFRFSVCLFATQNKDFLLEKRCTTHQQNNKTTFCFLFLVIKSMSALISSADASRHAGFISHSICVAFQLRHNWESTFENHEHGAHLQCKVSKAGAIARFHFPWLRVWLPFNYYKMLP